MNGVRKPSVSITSIVESWQTAGACAIGSVRAPIYMARGDLTLTLSLCVKRAFFGASTKCNHPADFKLRRVIERIIIARAIMAICARRALRRKPAPKLSGRPDQPPAPRCDRVRRLPVPTNYAYPRVISSR